MPALQLVDLSDFGGEPRILDLRVAERLGIGRPRNIRNLIDRNRQELERYGVLLHGEANSPDPLGRGRPTHEYHLNEGQALLICMKSDAPFAADVRQEVIEVFQAFRHGKLVLASPITTEVLDSRLQPMNEQIAYLTKSQAHLIESHEGLNAKVDKVHDNVIFLSNRIDDFVPRRYFEAWKSRQFDEVCLRFWGGYCPTCPVSNRTRLISDDGTRLEEAEDEHFRGRASNGVEDGWVTCRKDNLRLHNDRAFKRDMQARFEVFQQQRKELFGTSTTAPRSSKKGKSSFDRYDRRQGNLLA